MNKYLGKVGISLCLSHKPYCVLSNDYAETNVCTILFIFLIFKFLKVYEKMYAIVQFVRNNSAAVIPTNWFYYKKGKKRPEKSCNTLKRNKAVQEM